MKSTETLAICWRRRKASFYLWTIRRQNRIAAGIRRHSWSAVASVLLMTILVPIDLEISLRVLFFGAMAFAGLLWTIIERRRSWLLAIKDPALKEAAHRAMISFLRTRVALSDDHFRSREKTG